MDKLFTQAQLQELVLLSAEALGIRYPAIIEKDYYVTQSFIGIYLCRCSLAY